MQFCPKCKSIMMSNSEILKCRKCGYEMKGGEGNIVTVEKRRERDIPVIEDSDSVATLPTTDAKCPKCGNKKAYWWMRQLRAADESEVRFFRCTKCGKTWREYN